MVCVAWMMGAVGFGDRDVVGGSERGKKGEFAAERRSYEIIREPPREIVLTSDAASMASRWDGVMAGWDVDG